jgi:hypothetical protein
MTPVKELLIDFHPLESDTYIVVGNGIPCKVMGTGNVAVRCNNSNGTRDVIITNVWFVPELIETLFSLKQIQDKGINGVIGHTPDNVKCITLLDESQKELFTSYWEDGHGYVPDWSFIAPTENATAFYARSTKQDALLWHARLGHCSFDTLATMSEGDFATGIEVPHKEFRKYKEDVCPACIQAKLQRMPYHPSDKEKPDVLEHLHSDLAGPYQVPSLGGAMYLWLLYDRGSALFHAVPIVHKDDVEIELPDTINRWENITGKKVKYITSDNGGEFVNTLLKQYFSGKGIEHYTSLAYEHQQNGAAENAIKQCNNLARSLLYNAGLPNQLWGEAVVHAAYLHNVTYNKQIGMTPWEKFYGQTPNLTQLRTFGCITYFRIPDELRKKLDPKTGVGFYLGKAANSKAVRVLVKHPVNGRLSIKLCRDIVCVERYLTHPNVPAAQYFNRATIEDPQGLLELREDWPNLAKPSQALRPFQNLAPVVHVPDADDLNNRLSDLLAALQLSGESLIDHQGASGQDPGMEALAHDGDDSGPELSQGYISYFETSRDISSETVPDKDQGLSAEEFNNYEGHHSPLLADGKRYPSRDRHQPDRYQPSFAKRVHLDPPLAYAGYAMKATSHLFDHIAHSAVVEVDGFEPMTYYEAMQCPEWLMWKEALDSEFHSLLENKTWELVKREPGMKVIPCKWVFKIKRDADGNVSRYKCRLVAGGHRQKFGVDYDETFAPVSKATTLRVLLSVAAFRKWKVHQLDIKTAFLHGDIDAEVFMAQPEGYEEGFNLVCRLLKCLYGLKQAPRAWYQKLTSMLTEMGFSASIPDPSYG